MQQELVRVGSVGWLRNGLAAELMTTDDREILGHGFDAQKAAEENRKECYRLFAA